MNKNAIEKAVKTILKEIGEDLSREGLQDTPKRVANMYEEIFSGYNADAKVHLSKQFKCKKSEVVLVKDIDFCSMCEHHMMPFVGQIHIAYIPKDKVVGLSKLVRTVDVFAKRLQLQERLTQQIAESVFNYVDSKGVMVVADAMHMCVKMRGVKNTSSKTQTISCKGIFEDNLELQNNVLQQISL